MGYSIDDDDNDDSTAEEAVIQGMIEVAQRMIRVNNNNNSQEEESEIRINPAMKRHLELEIKTLQNAPRDEEKLRELLELKEEENEQIASMSLSISTHRPLI